jgi:hypothetical protein
MNVPPPAWAEGVAHLGLILTFPKGKGESGPFYKHTSKPSSSRPNPGEASGTNNRVLQLTRRMQKGELGSMSLMTTQAQLIRERDEQEDCNRKLACTREGKGRPGPSTTLPAVTATTLDVAP